MGTKRITIVGGGYTGAAAAVQLASAAPVEITLLEPRAEPGRGLAYATRDPDHRLNGPLDNHLLDPARPDRLREWCDRTGVLERDPAALAPNGAIYLRRGDFGDHVAHTLSQYASIRHHRALATGVHPRGETLEVVARDGARFESDLVIVATGNGAFTLPAALRGVAGHAALVADPFDADRIASIDRDARVLLVGAGLTALDVVSTLLRRGHTGPIVALSRHGIRPRPHRARVKDIDVRSLLARIEAEMPAHLRQTLDRGGIRALCDALRHRIDDGAREGIDWQVPFDEVRNSVWRFWPALPLAQKRRFLRHLRRFYDAHRFRAPPQNHAIACEAERSGTLSWRTGHLAGVEPAGGSLRASFRDAAGAVSVAEFDAVVNCAGLDPACGATDNPFLLDLARQGLVRRDPTGIGLQVDEECRPLDAHGRASPRLRVLGPPTAGSLGDPLGVIFIAPQIRRAIPAMLADLGLAPPTAAGAGPRA